MSTEQSRAELSMADSEADCIHQERRGLPGWVEISDLGTFVRSVLGRVRMYGARVALMSQSDQNARCLHAMELRHYAISARCSGAGRI
jgi:hypothetical protein